jgi:aspartate carbamoyltransferase catalytic subunit
VISEVDVVYQTRIDIERLQNKNIDLSIYNITPNVLRKMKENSIIMHPLPRSVEISRDVDSDPRAAYFRQAENGLFVRMALITLLLDND